ncbi:phosphoadenosine phosphosulfate reductase [Aliiroseovarius sp. KMU-50]|uniref:Phosphoadenosine phosphosulfate reductase n=1 Tax=Aliiroseovarius salicola TaxID=3009082 RepID=A0ABT4W054_9RHOB|nr:phosphoadenosine phosphosulfate reductase [Aliiroseovarius sp. KMU-50]MDA5093896.1 phosphoadenosine phosphosulfate reductase [Aliiroseovarius sp. KMU-50]
MLDDEPTRTDAFDLTEADFTEWLDAIDEMGEKRGYFEPVGARHSAILTDEGPTLVVTFETVDTVRQSEDHTPKGWDLVKGTGWSNLCILAHEESWFRDSSVYGYFDRLVDDGFFEDFDQVVFFGAGACGYAACAYSVVAPGATVIAIAPQSTLDASRAGWDRRFPKLRRTDFTSRYGYAPDMVEGAEAVFLLFDPAATEDAMHASLFQGDNIHPLRCRHMGSWLSGELWSMGVLPDLIHDAASGDLTPLSALQKLRKRREHLPYLSQLLNQLESEGRMRLVAALSRHVASLPGKAPRFSKALAQAERDIELENA